MRLPPYTLVHNCHIDATATHYKGGMNRRACLRLTGLSLAALLTPRLATARPRTTPVTAASLGPTRPANVEVGPGVRVDTLLRCGDTFGVGLTFGSDADYTATFPLPDGNVLLWVNHEFPPVPVERHTGILGRAPTADDLLDCMGASIVELRPRTGGGWEPVPDSARSWRLTGRSPNTQVTGPAAAILGPEVAGTLQNCGGGVTPWGTVLTCEENVRYHVPEGIGSRTGAIGAGAPTTPGLVPTPGLRGEHYGWVVEVDPHDRTWAPRRHTALARFRHESVAIDARHGRLIRAYMGDDRLGGGLWRYTSRSAWRRSLGRDEASDLLTEGTLEILKLDTPARGQWIPVTRATPVDPTARGHLTRLADHLKLPADWITRLATAKTLGDLYESDGAVLIDAWAAGLAAGGSPLGRPEGCVLLDGAVHVALTAGLGLAAEDAARPPIDHPDGCVIALRDRGTFVAIETVLVAGESFGNPDNLGIAGDTLLITSDAEAPREGWAHNSLLRVAADGSVERIVVGPPEAELCGPSFAPDGAMFLTVQHPDAAWGESAILCIWPDRA